MIAEETQVQEEEKLKEKSKRKPLTDEQRVRKNATARAERRVQSDKGLQAVIVELAVSNDVLGRIESNVKGFRELAAAEFERREGVDGRLLANNTDMVIHLSEISRRLGLMLQDTGWLKSKSTQIAEYTDEMVDSMNWLSKFFSGSKLQATEDRKEFLSLIRALRDNQSIDPRVYRSAKEGEGNRSGNIGLADAAVGAGLLSKLLEGAIKGAIGTGGIVAGFIAGVVSSISELFMAIGKGTASLFKRMVGADRLAKLFEPITKVFSRAIGNIFRFIGEERMIKGIGAIENGAKAVGGWMKVAIGNFARVTDGFFDIFRWAKEIAKPFVKIGKILGKLALPITVIMGAYDTLVEAFKSYERGDSFGDVLKNSVTGLINSLIAAPLDLIKNGAAWLLNKLGATDIAEGLKGWDFADWFAEIIDRVVTWGRNLFSKFFTHIFDIVGNISDGFDGGIFAGIGKSIQTMVHYLISKPIQFVIDTITSMLEKIPLFGKKAADWIRQNVNVEKLTGSGLTISDAPEFKNETGDVGLVDGVVKRHENKLAEKELKNRAVPSMEQENELADRMVKMDDVPLGAEMQTLKSQTDELNAVQIVPVPIASSSAGGGGIGSVVNNASNITYNASGVIDRTDALLQSRMSGWQ